MGIGGEEKVCTHVRARWEVWQKGYELDCDVDGVLYVFAVKGLFSQLAEKIASLLRR